MARPTRFDPAVSEQILKALRAGCVEADAAGSAGVPYGTYRTWKAKNQQFSAAVDIAKYQAKVRAVGTITKAIQSGSWKAAMAWLERRYPEEWGKREHFDVTIRREAEQIAQASGADPEWLIKRANEIAEQAIVNG